MNSRWKHWLEDSAYLFHFFSYLIMATNVGFSAPTDTNVWGTGYYYNFADLRTELFFLNNWETAWKWKRIVVKTMRNFLLWKTPLEMFFIISHNLIKYKSTPHPNFCLFLYNICCTCKHNYIARLYACNYWFIISIYFRTQLKLKTLLFPPQRINLRILIVETFYRK